MDRWSADKANRWYEQQPWLVGCNYIPRVAINQLEMWQAQTFAPEIIAGELDLAASLGFNTLRVFLHDLLWQADAEGFLSRLDRFLQLAAGRGMRPMLVFFDDCWNDNPQGGPQPAPRPGVHNSGWVRSPGSAAVNDPAAWGRLERYVSGVLNEFGRDERVLMWDLYNELGNNKQNESSLPLLAETFEWARAAAPQQPLTVGAWYANEVLNAFQLAASDIISFHCYGDAVALTARIAELQPHGRPLICTEYMARTASSRFASHLPIFKAQRVGCINWGLVSGKTQTIYPWGSPEGGPPPALWFHEIFHADGTPYDAEEVAVIRSLTGVVAGKH